MSTCGGPIETRTANSKWQANEDCKTDKPAPRRIGSGPSLDHTKQLQRVQADPSNARQRSHAPQPRVAAASRSDTKPAAASTKVDQAETVSVDAKIDELKKNLGIDSELRGAELEAEVDDRIGKLKESLNVNFKNPWDQRSKNIEAHIAKLGKSNGSRKDWRTLQQLVDLKCLLSPGVEGNINQMKMRLGMGGLEGNALEKAVDGEVNRLLGGVNFIGETTFGQIHDKIENKLKTVTKPDERAFLNRLQLAVDLQFKLPLKSELAQKIADTAPQVKTFIATLLVSKDPEIQSSYAKLTQREFSEYSHNMAQLHGGKPGDYELKIPLNASEHTKLCGILKDLADKGLIRKEDVDLITSATSPKATTPAPKPAVTAAR